MASLERVELSSQQDSLTIAISLTAPLVPTADRIASPDRLVFDFPGCTLKEGNRHIPVNRGPVKDLRLSLFSAHPMVARLVVDLRAPLDFELTPVGNQILIRIPFPKTQPALAAPVPTAAADKEPLAVISPPRAGPETANRPISRQPGAYRLMEEAKALKVEDLQVLENKADAGDSDAQARLALAYHAGVLLRKDDAEALRLLHLAAGRGSMAAEESLGIFSETGIGMERPDPAEALTWYEKAARQGSPDAATNIALMYANGKGVARDASQAVAWFQRAAEGGDSSAQYNLALMYERGDGVPQDFKQAVRWLTAAADQDLVPAILDLAELSLQPPDATLTSNVGRAIQLYEKAADLGSAVAQSTLGTIFMKGISGKVDYELAAKWYRKAADQGEPDGELGLGVLYGLGHGVSLDFEEARRLLTASADQGQIEAQYNLAIMCEEGKGAPADLDRAENYYQKAAERGMAKAQYRYGALLAKSSESSSNRVAAYKWLMLAQDSVKQSASILGDLRKSMNEQEIGEAERQVDNWRLQHRSNHR